MFGRVEKWKQEMIGGVRVEKKMLGCLVSRKLGRKEVENPWGSPFLNHYKLWKENGRENFDKKTSVKKPFCP